MDLQTPATGKNIFFLHYSKGLFDRLFDKFDRLEPRIFMKETNFSPIFRGSF